MSYLSQLQYAIGKPESTALIRQQPEHFQVKEQLSFELQGQGQHVYLLIEKRELNTNDVALSLARFAGVKQVAVGYAGLKDRHAVTTQWFSVDMAGKAEPDWSELNSNYIQIIEIVRHSRKLKRGAVSSNHFQITLSEFNGDQKELAQRLEFVQQHGIPNYFGEQRFGRNDANLKQAEKLVKGEIKRIKRHLRGIYLSAVRSYLFNLVLSQRVADKTWNQPIPGDVFVLDGSHSVFTVDAIDEDIVRRVNEFDIHPSGPMWGSGTPMTADEAMALEIRALQPHQAWCGFLESAGLKQERRALRVRVTNLEWEWQGSNVALKFGLPAGCYATSVLRELIAYSSS